MSTRPTSDRLRETLFNVLRPRMEGAAFLDLYAGSGAVGIEAMSRGAARVTFVERAPAALNVLKGNLARLGIIEGARVWEKSVNAFLRIHSAPNSKAEKDPERERHSLQGKDRKREENPQHERYDVVFLDPPYDAAQEYEAALGLMGGPAQDMLAEGAIVIVEHRRKFAVAEGYGSLRRTRVLEQGDVALSFYAPGAPAADLQ